MINISIRNESKFSRKIIFNYLRIYLPFMYSILLEFRYLFFKRQCVGFKNLYYSDGSWLERKSSKDLRSITEFVLDSFACNSKSCLQIGVGNSSFYKSANNFLFRFTGVTIIAEEYEYALKLIGKGQSNNSVYLCNKYELSECLPINFKVDLIIDNDLSSYACCKYHFEKLLIYYKSILNVDGMILIGKAGLIYFDSGFGINERLLNKFCLDFGFLHIEDKYCHILKAS